MEMSKSTKIALTRSGDYSDEVILVTIFVCSVVDRLQEMDSIVNLSNYLLLSPVCQHCQCL